MAAIYANISSATTTTLITKQAKVRGDIKTITITNHDDSDSNVIQLHLYDGSTTYVIAETTIPARTTLVLSDNLSFNSYVYNLRIVTSTTADTTVIIK
tara:strand:- start:31 stop:324 length:294 start_codon:yes stop_codon:yes gene_type:complete